MSKDIYLSELQKILSNKSVPDGVKDFTRETVESAISDISEQLPGPMSNAERLSLVEDRKRLRNLLADMAD
jgi:hypothetical protein